MYHIKKINDFDNNCNIAFLCGCQYIKESESDKRNVLKKFLESDENNLSCLIIENFFDFIKDLRKENSKLKLSKSFFSFDNSALIELLSAAIVDYIFIIHETFSTAAELGLFASNKITANKICLITPSSLFVEKSFITTFIEKAFILDDKNNIFYSHFKLITHITYNPSIKKIYKTNDYFDFYTYFYNNNIDKTLSSDILQFLRKNSPESILSCKNYFKHLYPKKIEKKYYLTISIDLFKAFLISLLTLPEVKNQLNKPKPIEQHIIFLSDYFHSLVLNTYSFYSKNRKNIVYPLKIKYYDYVDIDNFFYFILFIFDRACFIKFSVKNNSKFVFFKYKKRFSSHIIKKYSKIIERKKTAYERKFSYI